MQILICGFDIQSPDNMLQWSSFFFSQANSILDLGSNLEVLQKRKCIFLDILPLKYCMPIYRPILTKVKYVFNY